MTNVEKVLSEIRDGMVIGLGSGAASEKFIRELGERVRDGLSVHGVPTSKGSAKLATEVGIPLIELGDRLPLDLTVDGADEVDPYLNMIKGYGKALVREKIVAAASKRVVILIGPERVKEKQVNVLGARGKLPIEVVPFAVPYVKHVLAARGMKAEVLTEDGQVFVSDNGNTILHIAVTEITHPGQMEHDLLEIPGVVGTGLFVGVADVVLVQDGTTVTELKR